jgi:hypothetical protein
MLLFTLLTVLFLSCLVDALDVLGGPGIPFNHPLISCDPPMLTLVAGSGTFACTLKEAPTSDATLSFTVPEGLMFSACTLTFNAGNWHVHQTITVSTPLTFSDAVAKHLFKRKGKKSKKGKKKKKKNKKKKNKKKNKPKPIVAPNALAVIASLCMSGSSDTMVDAIYSVTPSYAPGGTCISWGYDTLLL